MSDVKLTRREIIVGTGAPVGAAALPPVAAMAPAAIVLEQGCYFVAGTRVPALALLSYLVCGREAQIAADYPFLPAGTVDAVQRWHADQSSTLSVGGMRLQRRHRTKRERQTAVRSL